MANVVHIHYDYDISEYVMDVYPDNSNNDHKDTDNNDRDDDDD